MVESQVVDEALSYAELFLAVKVFLYFLIGHALQVRSLSQELGHRSVARIPSRASKNTKI